MLNDAHGDEFATKSKQSLPRPESHHRDYGIHYARVTNIDDPDKQNRIKVRFHWLEEEGGPEMESGWITSCVPFAGPTDMRRGRRFGVDWPLPEVRSLVVIGFIDGNIHDAIWFGQPRYWEGESGAPRLEKDKHKDWAFRIALQNGWEHGVDTDGNEYKVTPGNYRHKCQCEYHASSRGTMTHISSKIRQVSLSVLRLLGVTIDQTNYPREDERAELREMKIDAMDGPPGRKDPGIGKFPDLEE